MRRVVQAVEGEHDQIEGVRGQSGQVRGVAHLESDAGIFRAGGLDHQRRIIQAEVVPAELEEEWSQTACPDSELEDLAAAELALERSQRRTLAGRDAGRAAELGDD